MSEEQEYQAREARHRAHLAAHMVVRADGTEVLPGDIVRDNQGRYSNVTFVRITRAPGDGSATNGKILVRMPEWGSQEYYPSVFDFRVVRRPGAASPYDVEA